MEAFQALVKFVGNKMEGITDEARNDPVLRKHARENGFPEEIQKVIGLLSKYRDILLEKEDINKNVPVQTLDQLFKDLDASGIDDEDDDEQAALKLREYYGIAGTSDP